MELGVIIEGIKGALELTNLLWLLGGLIGGIILAAIPGIGAELGIVLMIPLTYEAPSEAVFLMLCAMYVGGMYGGAISSILLKIPGHPSAAATVFDGYPLAQKGEAGKALAIAAYASAIGGFLSMLVVIFLSSGIAKIAISFGAAEMFALVLLALSAVAISSGKNVIRGLMMASIGLLATTIGTDPITGVERFTFGFSPLYDKLHFVPIIIGVFAVTEILEKIGSGIDVEIIAKKFHIPWPRKQEVIDTFPTICRSTLIGGFLGVLPAVGGTVASFMSYAFEVRVAKEPEKYGKGEIRGIAAAEAGNNSAASGALAPMLALGIPGSGITAIILGAFLLHGVRPGPLMFVNNQDLVMTIFGGMLLANIFLFFIGIWFSGFFAKVLEVPYPILAPIILALSVAGSFAIRNNLMDVLVMFIAGIIGLFIKKFNFPLLPLVMGVILGMLAEENFRRAILMQKNDLFGMFTRPLTLLILTIAFVSVVISLVIPIVNNRRLLKKISGELKDGGENSH